MAAPNLSMSAANVTAGASTWQRHRVAIRGSELVVRDRRATVVLTATVESWERDRRGTVTMQTSAGVVTAARAGCGCGGR